MGETNPLDIYRDIKGSYLEWGKLEKMYIDFIGGMKTMSAMGALVNMQLVYVGTDDYLADFRKPNPVWRHYILSITHRLCLEIELEIEKDPTLFKEYNYAGAIEKWKMLKENIPDSKFEYLTTDEFCCL